MAPLRFPSTSDILPHRNVVNSGGGGEWATLGWFSVTRELMMMRKDLTVHPRLGVVCDFAVSPRWAVIF